MKLKVLTPIKVLIDCPITKVIAEAENGHFCLLPNHIDFVAALVPGILSFTTEMGEEVLVAVDEGILVECDRATGKTAIALDKIINQKDQDVICIYCAIGQRSSAVAKLIAELRKRKAMEYSLEEFLTMFP